MTKTRRDFLKTSIATAFAVAFPASKMAYGEAQADIPAASETAPPPLTQGKFQPSWDSLAQYECPEWFRDAKFGIWAHWSAQCVPEHGDWYAKSMYEEGSGDYKYHCATYGHPSVFGFKDIDNIWHAENWDPSKMMDLYKRAGAKYFCALANHHDNFDTWNSKYQPWNTVNIGPKKDIIGIWARTARAAGLKFGVTVHASHTWNWLEVAQGADKTGPYAGVPYDGVLTKADGTGKWWEGYDPQDLYAQNHPVGGGGWEFQGSKYPPSKAYCEKFYNRTVDLIHQHNPDLLYFDDSQLPLNPVSDVGLRIVSEYYNYNTNKNGRLGAVLNTKGLDDQQRKCMVLDFERGQSDKIEPSPWQTDTCIGNWHYDRALYERHGYKTPRLVVRMLVDIVAKNGNLLLNIPVRGDGSFDPDEIAFLEDMATWMQVNESSIFGTRPWKISGEGPLKIKGGGFSEGGADHMGENDFRFATKGDTLYVTGMGWPDSGKYSVRTLASSEGGIVGDIKSIELLGHDGTLEFARTPNALEVTLPADKPCDYAWVMKIEGLDLAASQPIAPVYTSTVKQAADGSLTLLAATASIDGSQQLQGTGDDTNIGFWDKGTDSINWNVHVDTPGAYNVVVKASSEAGTALAIAFGQIQSVTATVPSTADWDTYTTVTAGVITIPAAGVFAVKVGASDPANWHAANVEWVKLTLASTH